MEHQTKHHSKNAPLDSHTHRVFYHTKDLTDFYDANIETFQEAPLGVCMKVEKMLPIKVVEWLVKAMIFGTVLPEYDRYEYHPYESKELFSIEDYLLDHVNNPRQIEGEQIGSAYKSIIRAAIIFSAYPEIECLRINDFTIQNGGSEDLGVDLPIGECVVYQNKVK